MIQSFKKFCKVGAILPLFLCSIVNAQNENLGVNFSPRAGIGFSYAGQDDLDKKSFKISPDAGLEIKIDLHKNFGITTGFFYNQKSKYYSYNSATSFFDDLANSFFGGFGDLDTIFTSIIGTTSDFVNDSIYSNYKGKVNIHYLQIPIMATLDVHNFSVSAGGYFAFKMGAKSTESLKQEFPMYSTFKPALSDSSIAPLVDFFLMAYPALETPQTSEVTPDFVNSSDFGLQFEVAGRFDEHFKMAATVSYGLKNYGLDENTHPGKHFYISFNMGVTFGKIKGTKVSAKLF